MSFPYLDLPAFLLRTVMPSQDVALVEASQPGFVATRIALATSYINARLRKRYGNDVGQGNALPLGQVPPALEASGTSPPSVSLTGRPTLGSMQMKIQITTGGALGVAVFEWSKDNGVTWVTGVTTALSVPLTGTGMSAAFTTGTYSTDNLYAAATPVPEAVLEWIVSMVTVDVYRKRGVDPQDPTIALHVKDRDDAIAEIKEAADSKEGLFDLPVSEDLDSAITTSGVHSISSASPYSWTWDEYRRGVAEDSQGGSRVR